MMKRNICFINQIFLLLAFGGLLLSGCVDQNEAFIQGTWHYDHNPDRLSIDHAPADDFEYWTFDNGTFSTYSCWLHINQDNGYYRVIGLDDESITIELYHKRAYSSEDTRQIKIYINWDGDEIRFSSTTYKRGLP
jgi:hypothetical protein